MATNEMLEADPTCAGRPVTTAQVAILDDDGRPVPDGEVGHVCIKGPMVMPGYWNNPEATAAAFFPGRWLNSGDFGRMVDGMLYLESRKRDMIIRGGENIYPIEIENRLDEHPAVLESAVIGVDHRTLGQEVKAFVVTKPGRTVDVDALKAFVGETLAYYKVPEYIEVQTEHLPRNASGKVLKHVLAGEAENTFVED
jgi:acyl-CoA synthetase (AMP-forming)/AMP-acid ligase II